MSKYGCSVNTETKQTVYNYIKYNDYMLGLISSKTNVLCTVLKKPAKVKDSTNVNCDKQQDLNLWIRWHITSGGRFRCYGGQAAEQSHQYHSSILNNQELEHINLQGLGLTQLDSPSPGYQSSDFWNEWVRPQSSASPASQSCILLIKTGDFHWLWDKCHCAYSRIQQGKLHIPRNYNKPNSRIIHRYTITTTLSQMSHKYISTQWMHLPSSLWDIEAQPPAFQAVLDIGGVQCCTGGKQGIHSRLVLCGGQFCSILNTGLGIPAMTIPCCVLSSGVFCPSVAFKWMFTLDDGTLPMSIAFNQVALIRNAFHTGCSRNPVVWAHRVSKHFKCNDFVLASHTGSGYEHFHLVSKHLDICPAQQVWAFIRSCSTQSKSVLISTHLLLEKWYWRMDLSWHWP